MPKIALANMDLATRVRFAVACATFAPCPKWNRWAKYIAGHMGEADFLAEIPEWRATNWAATAWSALTEGLDNGATPHVIALAEWAGSGAGIESLPLQEGTGA